MEKGIQSATCSLLKPPTKGRFAGKVETTVRLAYIPVPSTGARYILRLNLCPHFRLKMKGFQLASVLFRFCVNVTHTSQSPGKRNP